SVAGCMYRVVQTTGPDGKNLLKLLPIPKSSGNVVPLVQSSAMSNNPKVKISSPVHLTFKTQLGRTTAPSSVQLPVFQSPNPGKIILARALDKQGGVRAGSEKESLPAKSNPNAKGSCVSADRTLQHVAVTSSSEQGKAAGVLVNTKPVPGPMKSPVLPSGHHLQIPADAEVKSVPASLLPPSIQQKILAAAAANESGGAEAKKMPTVIFVSPVNTVKTVLPKSLQAVCSKPAPDASKTLIMTAAQKARGSPGAAASAGQQCHAPMKWIVQESPQPCLIPVKSSNNVASKILKTLSDAKSVEVSSANILSLCSSGPGGSQAKITPLKDNALVMYSGKVYLLTKKGSDVLLDQAGIQASSSCASSRKGTSKLIDSTEVIKIRNKVMNLVLSKSKGMALSQKGPKVCTSSKDSSPAGFSNDLKSAPAPLVTPGVKEQSSTVPQGKGLAFTESVSSGMTPVTALGTGENMCQDGKERIHSPKAASDVLPQSKQECAFSEDWQKVQHEEMQSLGSGNQTERQEKPRRKKYSKLRKKFGLYKEERVYLKRIPLMTCEKPGGRGCSSNSSERRNDSCSSSSLDVAITDQQHKCIKEEKITVDLEEEVSKKRKIKSAPLTDSGKRRKASGKSTTNSGTEDTGPSSITCSRSVSPPPVLLQPSVSTDFVTSSVGRDVEQEPPSQNSDVTDSDIPVLVSCEDRASVCEGSFRDDAFPLTPPDLAETIRDEKIKRLKQLLREREAALEEMRRK
ncbi:LRIF1 factor, partial [Penelope pileata]|nr:LRIF1 factor [Penelope pileata]